MTPDTFVFPSILFAGLLFCAALPTGRLLATAAEPPGKAQTGFTERRIENEPRDRYGRV